MPRPRKPPRLSQRGGVWYIVHHDGSRDCRVSAGTRDRDDAEAFFARWLGERQKENGTGRLQSPDSLPVSVALATWLEHHAANLKSGGRSAQAAVFLLDFFGSRLVSDITPETLNAYVKWRRDTGRGTRTISPATKDAPAVYSVLTDTTIRLELATLRAALRWSVENGYLTHSPVIKLPGSPAKRERWLTRDEADALIAECREPYLRLFVIVALYTGARKQAVLSLRWVQVDFASKLIYLRAPGERKTTKGKATIPIADPLLDAMKAAKSTAKTPWVIELTEEQANRIRAAGLAPVGDIKKGFANACRRARLSDVTPHTLRHTCGSWLAQAGVDMFRIAEWLGHTYAQTSELYSHLSPDHLRSAADALSRSR